MNFQIEQLVIWSKKNDLDPRIIQFKPNKLNIITGASRTGKSAIIPILDYCLASSECSIPIDVIRDNVSWYGLVIQCVNEKLFLARSGPVGEKASSEFYIERNFDGDIPHSIAQSNETLDGIKQILNDISGVPYLNRDENDSALNARLSFRDLVHLSFQGQDIIANQKILFDKTHKNVYKERLKNWFPFILGAESVEFIESKRNLEDLKSKLKWYEREYSRIKKISEEWIHKILRQIIIAKGYNLYKEEISENNLPVDQNEKILTLLDIAKKILETPTETLVSSSKSIDSSMKLLRSFKGKEDNLSFIISETQKRIDNIEKLRSTVDSYKENSNKKIERLQLAKWFKENVIVNDNGEDSKERYSFLECEVEKICNVLLRYENENKMMLPLPAALNREYESLKSDLEDLIEQKNSLAVYFKEEKEKNTKLKEYEQRNNDMFVLLGELNVTVNIIEGLVSDDKNAEEIRSLKDKIKALNDRIANIDTKKRLEIALDKLNTKTLIRLKTLDIEERYKESLSRFSIKDLDVKVRDKNGSWHSLTEVGSASNWLSFHLSISCALQEFFFEQKSPTSSVPSFVVFDQPSQVYFPSLKGNKEVDDIIAFKDDDKNAVKAIFQTISDSIKSTNGAWQAIILEHADNAIYGDIEDIYQVEEWRNGKKMIPSSWYE